VVISSVLFDFFSKPPKNVGKKKDPFLRNTIFQVVNKSLVVLVVVSRLQQREPKRRKVGALLRKVVLFY